MFLLVCVLDCKVRLMLAFQTSTSFLSVPRTSQAYYPNSIFHSRRPSVSVDKMGMARDLAFSPGLLMTGRRTHNTTDAYVAAPACVKRKSRSVRLHPPLRQENNLGFLEAKIVSKPQSWQAPHAKADAATQECNWSQAVGWVGFEHIDGTIPKSAHFINSTKTY